MNREDQLLDHLAKALKEYAVKNGPVDYATIILACEVLKTTFVHEFINGHEASHAESPAEVGS